MGGAARIPGPARPRPVRPARPRRVGARRDPERRGVLRRRQHLVAREAVRLPTRTTSVCGSRSTRSRTGPSSPVFPGCATTSSGWCARPSTSSTPTRRRCCARSRARVDEVRAGRNPLDEGGLVGLFASPAQRGVLGQVQALMSVLEGHGNVVMDDLGREYVAGQERMSRVLSQRRKMGGLTGALQKLLGIEQKMKQYEVGEQFVRGVYDSRGPARVRRGLAGAGKPADGRRADASLPPGWPASPLPACEPRRRARAISGPAPVWSSRAAAAPTRSRCSRSRASTASTCTRSTSITACAPAPSTTRVRSSALPRASARTRTSCGSTSVVVRTSRRALVPRGTRSSSAFGAMSVQR